MEGSHGRFFHDPHGAAQVRVAGSGGGAGRDRCGNIFALAHTHPAQPRSAHAQQHDVSCMLLPAAVDDAPARLPARAGWLAFRRPTPPRGTVEAGAGRGDALAQLLGVMPERLVAAGVPFVIMPPRSCLSPASRCPCGSGCASVHALTCMHTRAHTLTPARRRSRKDTRL